VAVQYLKELGHEVPLTDVTYVSEDDSSFQLRVVVSTAAARDDIVKSSSNSSIVIVALAQCVVLSLKDTPGSSTVKTFIASISRAVETVTINDYYCYRFVWDSWQYLSTYVQGRVAGTVVLSRGVVDKTFRGADIAVSGTGSEVQTAVALLDDKFSKILFRDCSVAAMAASEGFLEAMKADLQLISKQNNKDMKVIY
jgi:hypothetical protein